MKKYLPKILGSATLAALFCITSPYVFAAGGGTIPQLDQFTSTTTPSSAITQTSWGKHIKITGLTTGLCLALDSNSFVTTAACAGGGGGGQTPWTQAIDGAGYDLTDAGIVTGKKFVATSTLDVSSFQQFLANGSSTLQAFTFTNATGTNATTTALAISSIGSKILSTNTNGSVLGASIGSGLSFSANSLSNTGVLSVSCTTITCSGTNPASFSIGNGAIANIQLANSTISGVALGGTLNALTATNSTLTFSGSYDGTTARTVGLNLANANTWTVLQTFSAGVLGNASSTLTLFSAINATSTNATSTNLYVSGDTTLGSATGLVLRSSGLVGSYAGTSCTNQFPRSLNASGAATCASVANTDLLNASMTFSSTNSTLTIGGSPQVLGGLPFTADINLAHANLWTASSTFVGGLSSINSTSTNATSTNSFSSVASSTSLFSTSLNTGLITSGLINGQTISSAANFTGTLTAISGLVTFLNTLHTGSSTLQNFTALQSTSTNATSTNSFATTASSTNLYTNFLSVASSTQSANWGVAIATSTLFSAQVGNQWASTTPAAAGSSVLVDFQKGNFVRIILSQATNIVISATSSNMLDGPKVLKICQDATGSRTATFFPNALRWPTQGTTPGATTTVSSAANSCTYIGGIYDSLYGILSIMGSTTGVQIN